MVPILPSPEAAQSFDQKVSSADDEIKAAVSAGQKKEVTITITDKEVNSKIIQLRAKGELPVKEASINFGDGNFLAYAMAETPGINAKMGVIGRVEIVDGSLKIVVDEFNLGKLPLPQTVKTRVEQLLNIMLSLRLADVPLEITSVQFTNHQLTVIGTTETGK